LLLSAYLPQAIQLLVHKLPSCHWMPLKMWLWWIDTRLAVLMPMRKLGIRLIDLAISLREEAEALRPPIG
jgi:hypothetical protein